MDILIRDFPSMYPVQPEDSSTSSPNCFQLSTKNRAHCLSLPLSSSRKSKRTLLSRNGSREGRVHSTETGLLPGLRSLRIRGSPSIPAVRVCSLSEYECESTGSSESPPAFSRSPGVLSLESVELQVLKGATSVGGSMVEWHQGREDNGNKGYTEQEMKSSVVRAVYEAGKEYQRARARLQNLLLVASELHDFPSSPPGVSEENASNRSSVQSGALLADEDWAPSNLAVGADVERVRCDNVIDVGSVSEVTRLAARCAVVEAEEALRNRLSEVHVQAQVIDHCIEMLDKGGPFQMARFVVQEVTDAFSRCGNKAQLAVPIDLDLAVRGYDEHAVRFLQELPFDQVLKIQSVRSDSELFHPRQVRMGMPLEFDSTKMHGGDFFAGENCAWGGRPSEMCLVDGMGGAITSPINAELASQGFQNMVSVSPRFFSSCPGQASLVDSVRGGVLPPADKDWASSYYEEQVSDPFGAPLGELPARSLNDIPYFGGREALERALEAMYNQSPELSATAEFYLASSLSSTPLSTGEVGGNLQKDIDGRDSAIPPQSRDGLMEKSKLRCSKEVIPMSGPMRLEVDQIMGKREGSLAMEVDLEEVPGRGDVNVGKVLGVMKTVLCGMILLGVALSMAMKSNLLSLFVDLGAVAAFFSGCYFSAAVVGAVPLPSIWPFQKQFIGNRWQLQGSLHQCQHVGVKGARMAWAPVLWSFGWAAALFSIATVLALVMRATHFAILGATRVVLTSAQFISAHAFLPLLFPSSFKVSLWMYMIRAFVDSGLPSLSFASEWAMLALSVLISVTSVSVLFIRYTSIGGAL